jgi:hypothetical protein
LFPTESLQTIDITKHSVIYIRDWEFYVVTKENSVMIKNQNG